MTLKDESNFIETKRNRVLITNFNTLNYPYLNNLFLFLASQRHPTNELTLCIEFSLICIDKTNLSYQELHSFHPNNPPKRVTVTLSQEIYQFTLSIGILYQRLFPRNST